MYWIGFKVGQIHLLLLMTIIRLAVRLSDIQNGVALLADWLLSLQHIRHLLSFSTAQTLACSLILSQLDYAARVVTQSDRFTPLQPLLQSYVGCRYSND